MKNKTILILAAGLGSRFGGLKQLEPFGPNNEFIIDYSVYDAVRSGFNKIVFVIKEENIKIFKDTIGKRMDKFLKTNNIKVEYVFQNLDNVPKEYKIPVDRIKPLGTAHAVLCAKNYITEPFLMINADDFYGYDAFLETSKYIDENKNNDIGLVGYKVKNTITENGSVKRGVCIHKNNKLLGIIESSILKEKNQIKATSLEKNETQIIGEDELVSMNMIVFYPNIFEKLENKFIDFLNNKDLYNDEYLIPDIVTSEIIEDNATVNLIETKSIWAGVTYKEDKQSVIDFINNLIKKGIYPNNLWEKNK